MNRTAGGLLMGLVVGSIGTLLVLRIKKAIEDDDLERLTERLAEQVNAIEKRVVPKESS